jgi:hypothetical protein
LLLLTLCFLNLAPIKGFYIPNFPFSLVLLKQPKKEKEMYISQALREIHQSANLWQVKHAIEASTTHSKDEINRLFQTLQVTNNCAFLIDILERTAQMDEAKTLLSDLPVAEDFQVAVELAKVIVENHYLDGLLSEMPILKFDHWLKKALDIHNLKKADRSIIGKWVFNALHSYFEKHPVYTLLAYPYIYSDVKEDFSLSLKQRLIINAVVINLYLSFFKDQGETPEQFKARTVEIRRIALESKYVSLNFSNVTSLSDLKTVLKTLHYTQPDKDAYRAIGNYIERFLLKKPFTERGKSTGKSTPRNQNPFLGHGWGYVDETFRTLQLTDSLDEDNISILSFDPNLSRTLDNEPVKASDFAQQRVLVERHFPNFESVFIGRRGSENYIRLYNQFLYDNCDESEIKQLITFLKNTPRSMRYEEFRACIYIVLCLMTGFPLDGNASIHIHECEYQKEKIRIGNMNIFIQTNELEIFNYTVTLSIPVLSPGQSNAYAKAPYLYETVDINHLKVILHSDVSDLIIRFYNQFKDKAKTIKFEGYQKPALVTAFKSVLEKAGLDPRVTPAYLTHYVQGLAIRYSRGDLWQGLALSNKDKSLTIAQKFYSTIRHKTLYELVQQLSLKHFAIHHNLVAHHPNLRDYYGSDLLPKKSYLIKITNACYSFLARRQALEKLSINDLVDVINVMGFYTQWIISFSTAARNSKVSKPTLNCVSSQGYCRLNDKSRHNGYQAKILYLSIIARQQITAYDLFIQKLCKLENIKIDFKRTDEYLLVDKYTSRNGKYRLVTMPFSMRVAQSLVSKIEQLNLPFLNELIPNAARHFLRSKALNGGLPPEVIDALLGHWHMGSEPWSSYGLFDFQGFRSALEPFIENIQKELNIQSTMWEK